jgi:DNA invertase Pin-like site-specific DNA recombinase
MPVRLCLLLKSIDMKKFVVYYRVSSLRSRDSSPGLEAQRASVTQYIEGVAGAVVTAGFVEAESGRKSSRPKLTAALSEANATAATLLIARLAGLIRDTSLLRNLRDARVDFACCDNPHVNASTINALAALAADEANLISARTKEALAAKRDRGETMGTPENLTDEARAKSMMVRQQQAKEAAGPVSGIIAEKRRMDWTYQQIADYLNDAKHTTPRGFQWTPIAVRRAFLIDNVLSELDSDTEIN